MGQCVRDVLLCFQLTRNKFKFNFLSRGQLESLNLDKIFLPFGNLIFAIIARMEIILICHKKLLAV